MKTIDHASREFVLAIIHQVHDMSLATIRPDGFPQATVVNFANDDLTLYVGIGLDSQKAHNIQNNNKVSLTITCPYTDWNRIKGVSMAALAEIVHDADEFEHAAECMLRRFPELKKIGAGSAKLPWEGAIFVRLSPTVISLVDYEKGFGHTELVAVN